MTKQYFSLSFVLAASLLLSALPTHAASDTFTVKVVGVSKDKHRGDSSPAKQHQQCDKTFSGSHWCSTQEYLDGGMEMDADKKLDTAWIRPVIVGSMYNSKGDILFVDASGGAITTKQLNCRQWASESASDSGPVLLKANNDDNQIVTVEICSEKLPSLCCAPVADK